MDSNHRMSESKSDALTGLGEPPRYGADNWIRTSDLHLTKMVHYLCVISAHWLRWRESNSHHGFWRPL